MCRGKCYKMRVKNRGEIVISEILEALKNGGVSF